MQKYNTAGGITGGGKNGKRYRKFKRLYTNFVNIRGYITNYRKIGAFKKLIITRKNY